jgi:3-deoxy-D-manno-octulosonic-acid transferase
LKLIFPESSSGIGDGDSEALYSMLAKGLYQCGMLGLKVAMDVGAVFNPKLKKGVEGRRGLFDDLKQVLPGLIQGRKVAWFHAASLGEFEQGRPVIEEFKKCYPEFYIVLTFFSPSGYEVRKNYPGADYICYLPIDTASNAKEFIHILNPQIVFFIKYEFWYNYLKVLHTRKIPVLSFSTIFRPGQVFFRFYGNFYRNLLTYFNHILVQNQESIALLNGIGISNCSLAGDTRFDRVKSIAASARILPEISSFVENSFCLVAGSVWEADIEVLIPALNALSQNIKAIIAPHEIKKEQMAVWMQKLNGKSVLYSDYISQEKKDSYDYLIIDNIGMLSSLYRYGQVAYIGGAFGAGLHNILEAATFRLPVLFGNKKYKKFQEAVDLIALDGARAVENEFDLKQLIERLEADPNQREVMGFVSGQYVLRNTGATDRVMEQVRQLIHR